MIATFNTYDPLAGMAYRDHEDTCMNAYDKCWDKAADCHHRGDLIGEQIYRNLAKAWLDCRHRLGATPFGGYYR